MKVLFLIAFWWSVLLATAQTAKYTTTTILKDSDVQQGEVDCFEMGGEKPKKNKKKRLNTKPETIPNNGFYADFGMDAGLPPVNDYYQGVFTGNIAIGYQIAHFLQLSIGTGIGTRGSRALTPSILFRPAIGYRFPSTKKMHLTLDVGVSFEEHEYRIRDVNGIAQPDYKIL